MSMLIIMAVLYLLSLRSLNFNLRSSHIHNENTEVVVDSVASRFADVVPVESYELSDSIKFYLFTRNNLDIHGQLIHKYNVKYSDFNEKLPVIFIIHGWTDDKDSEWIKEMYTLMASKQKWNIFLLDWSPLSETSLSIARSHCELVSDKLSAFILHLVATYSKVLYQRIHYIGHGLGTLIAGYSGRFLQGISSKNKIGRITGLDPNIQPDFRSFKSSDDLNKTDASFVDVIHTNGGGFGGIEPIGHVDFYPNGGKRQFGCGSLFCSHIRSCEYWTASIENPKRFKAYHVNSWNDYVERKHHKLRTYYMGLAADKRMPSGKYFLEISAEDFAFDKDNLI